MAGQSNSQNKGHLYKGILEEYVCPAEEAVELRLVSEEADLINDSKRFRPEFCHQIFGDGESVFGYRNLRIKLYFSAARLITYLGVKYSNRIPASIVKKEGVEPDDVMKIIGEYLQPGFLTNMSDFISALAKEESFVPYGEKLHSFTVNQEGNEQEFEIYKSTDLTAGFTDYHERMRIFVMWYIDAASYIIPEEDRWDYFVIYQKWMVEGKPRYSFVGYTSTYKCYSFPVRTRRKISQVLVLPPFQRKGLGSELLNAIYRNYISDPLVTDITVEDPSEAFTRVRDIIDAKNCSELASYHKDKLKNGFSEEMYKEAQGKLKINKKQARKIYEILRLKATDFSNHQAYRAYRLEIKKRLNAPYQRQKEDMKKLKRTLSPEEYQAAIQCFSREQRIEQLENQYRELEDEYRIVLEKLAARY